MSLRPSAFVVLPLTLIASLLVGGCDSRSPGDAQPASAATGTQSDPNGTESDKKGFNGTLDIANRGSAMPDLVFNDPSGKTLRTTDLKGKPVLINLWATWCGPCVLEMPMLDAMAEKYRDKLTVIAVSQDAGQSEKVWQLFADRKFAHLQPWLDPEMSLSSQYNTGVLPTTVLYDAEGKEVWRMVGAHDWQSPRTDAMLADTLQK